MTFGQLKNSYFYRNAMVYVTKESEFLRYDFIRINERHRYVEYGIDCQ